MAARVALGFAWSFAVAGPTSGRAQDLSSLAALTNLQSMVSQISVGTHRTGEDGPKGVATADFDQDGHPDLAVSNTDGTVTVLFGLGDGRFSAPRHLRTAAPGSGQTTSLRGLVAADFDQDSYPDIAVAEPFVGKVYVFTHRDERGFGPPTILETWRGARNLETGDFDGDGQPDLAVAGPGGGFRQYRGLAGATFSNVVTLTALNFEGTEFPKPLFSVKAFRPVGSLGDWVAVGHAEGTNLWLLAPASNGVLSVRSTLGGRADIHGLAVGPVYRPIASGVNDLVTVFRDTGMFEVHLGTNTPAGFALHAPDGSDQRIREYVPGGPRAVALVDLDKDGWNDLVVAVRNLDRVLTYLNDRSGHLRLATARPVGSSPRELATADFNADGRPDLAVMNRGSADLSVLVAADQGGGYRAVDGLYLVDGQVVGLTLVDFNQDGFDDVIQLHRASGDFSVRLATNDGSGLLLPPVFYTVGNVPAAQVIVDVNHDDLPDVVTANLGTRSIERGSVSVRLGVLQAPGMLGPELRIELPPEADGRLFALVPGDLDGDGTIDLVVGLLDGKLAFFRGGGDGSFTPVRTRQLTTLESPVARPRSLTLADLDRDGDLDLAGLDASGEMWVMENPASETGPSGTLLDAASVVTRRFPRPPGSSGAGGRKIVAVNHDGDGFPDLIVGSGSAAWIYRGLGGSATNLATPPVRMAGISNVIADFLLKDLDGDGNSDVVLSCRDRDCLTVFSSRNALATGLPFDAPSSRFVAVGNLDGDGKPDFVGSGRVLWTSLSSRPSRPTPPLVEVESRPRLPKVVFNEILASNTELPLEPDGDRTSDWFELHNGESVARSLSGWSVELRFRDEAGRLSATNYAFPPTAFLAPRGHLLLVASEVRRSFYHTGWRLPASGGTLVLRDPRGQSVDQVTYPSLRPNISYARYRDALRSFVFNPFPSPGRSNPVNGTTEPTLKFTAIDPGSFTPGQPIRLHCEVAEDLGATAGVIAFFRTLGFDQTSPAGEIPMYDDGAHGDGAANDGRYAGDLPFTVATPTELQLIFEVTDLDDNRVTAPEDPEFGTPDALGNAYQIGFHQPSPGLEISEILAWNTHGLADGTNGYPDWLEVRNRSAQRTLLTDISVSQQIGDNPRYHFPTGRWLEPGEHFVVLCDNDPERGPNHAPIALNRAGDTVMLTGLTTNGSRTLIDVVRFGPQSPDRAWARLGAAGPFWSLPPTPTNGNVTPQVIDGTERGWFGTVLRRAGQDGQAGQDEALVAVPTRAGIPGTVEVADELDPSAWRMLDQFSGDGIERVYRWPLTNALFFRWR